MKQRLSELSLVASSVVIFFFVLIGIFAGHEMDRHDRKDMERKHRKELKEEKEKNHPKEEKKEEKKKEPEKDPSLSDEYYYPWEKQEKRTSLKREKSYNYNILCNKDHYKGVPKEEHPNGVRLVG